MNAKQQATLAQFSAYYQSEQNGEVDTKTQDGGHGNLVVCIKQGKSYRSFTIGPRGGVFFRPQGSTRRGVYTATSPNQVPAEMTPPYNFA